MDIKEKFLELVKAYKRSPESKLPKYTSNPFTIGILRLGKKR